MTVNLSSSRQVNKFPMSAAKKMQREQYVELKDPCQGEMGLEELKSFPYA